MVILIVAGGKGTRLWPLSTANYPKQLIDVTGQGTSLIQQAFVRAKKITTVDKIFIATEISHAHLIAEQIPELDRENIIVEPSRKNTMAAIITALSLISKKFGENETIASLWADHYIRDWRGLKNSLNLAAEISEKLQKIIAIGSEPNYPHTGMGYIQKGDSIDSRGQVHKVVAFKEKPEFFKAKEYTRSGDYLWNTGYIITSYKILKLKLNNAKIDRHWLNQLNLIDKATTREEINSIFTKFNNEPIDTALNEKLDDMLVISANFDWLDVGGIKEVHLVSDKDKNGVSVNPDCNLIYEANNRNVYINNYGDKPVAVIGLDDVAVINTEHGILVVKLSESQKVKDAAEYFNKK